MPRFYFELVEDGVIAKSHYGLELHEIAANDLDLAVDLAQILARRAADETSGPVMVTISDDAKHPLARIRLSPESEAPMSGPAEEAANQEALYFEEAPALASEVDERLMLHRRRGLS
jgi:hypothetical protein